MRTVLFRYITLFQFFIFKIYEIGFEIILLGESS